MSRAAELLKTTDTPVKDISIQVGYPNQLHFFQSLQKCIWTVSPENIARKTGSFMWLIIPDVTAHDLHSNLSKIHSNHFR